MVAGLPSLLRTEATRKPATNCLSRHSGGSGQLSTGRVLADQIQSCGTITSMPARDADVMARRWAGTGGML